MKSENDNIKLPTKQNTQDTIFNKYLTDIEEFPQYITNYTDITRRAHTKILSPAYQNLNLDSVFIRANGELINIEHHTTLTKEKMARDNEYFNTLFSATLHSVEQFIMYTGKLPIDKSLYLNYRDSYSPNFFITQKIIGEVRLNNLRYKVENNKKITPFDIIDLIWMPTFQICADENLIMELAEIYSKIEIPYKTSQTIKTCLGLWAGKYVKSNENIKKILEKLNMSAIIQRPFEEEFRDAVIEGKLERAEEKGKKIGKEIGKKIGKEKEREKIIEKLLKIHTEKEISEITETPIKTVQKIKKKIEEK